MAVFRAAEKFSIWAVRFFQLCFAIILTGVFAWFLHECRSNHFATLHQISVPLAFSVLAMFVCFFSIISICFLGRTLQWVAAILDIFIFAGYLASAVLYRHNYHILGYNNELRNYLIAARTYRGQDSDHIRITNLVRLGAALIIIQVILFFITMILSVLAARSKSNADGHAVGEKRSRFGRRNRVDNHGGIMA